MREHTMAHLDVYLEEFERNCTAAGGVVHWARDAEEARSIVVRAGEGDAAATEVIKIKSMTTEEIGLNQALEAAGMHPYETDLAELIIQLGRISRRILWCRRCTRTGSRFARSFSAR